MEVGEGGPWKTRIKVEATGLEDDNLQPVCESFSQVVSDDDDESTKSKVCAICDSQTEFDKETGKAKPDELFICFDFESQVEVKNDITAYDLRFKLQESVEKNPRAAGVNVVRVTDFWVQENEYIPYMDIAALEDAQDEIDAEAEDGGGTDRDLLYAY